jgi:hypothetical protein
MCKTLSAIQRAAVHQCTLYASWHGLSALACDSIVGTTDKHN